MMEPGAQPPRHYSFFIVWHKIRYIRYYNVWRVFHPVVSSYALDDVPLGQLGPYSSKFFQTAGGLEHVL